MEFTDLPEDCQVLILKRLPLSQLVHFARTSKEMRNIVFNSSQLWHDKIDIYQNQFEEAFSIQISKFNDLTLINLLNKLSEPCKHAITRVRLDFTSITWGGIAELLGECPRLKSLSINCCPAIQLNETSLRLLIDRKLESLAFFQVPINGLFLMSGTVYAFSRGGLMVREDLNIPVDYFEHPTCIRCGQDHWDERMSFGRPCQTCQTTSHQCPQRCHRWAMCAWCTKILPGCAYCDPNYSLISRKAQRCARRRCPARRWICFDCINNKRFHAETGDFCLECRSDLATLRPEHNSVGEGNRINEFVDLDSSTLFD